MMKKNQIHSQMVILNLPQIITTKKIRIINKLITKKMRQLLLMSLPAPDQATQAHHPLLPTQAARPIHLNQVRLPQTQEQADKHPVKPQMATPMTLAADPAQPWPLSQYCCLSRLLPCSSSSIARGRELKKATHLQKKTTEKRRHSNKGGKE